MKSMFLIFILTTSFHSLILTSDPDPSGAAAAVVAAKNPVAAKTEREIYIVRRKTKKEVDEIALRIEKNEYVYCSRCRLKNYTDICDLCGKRLISVIKLRNFLASTMLCPACHACKRRGQEVCDKCNKALVTERTFLDKIIPHRQLTKTDLEKIIPHRHTKKHLTEEEEKLMMNKDQKKKK
jgi:hypothetical protein